MVHRYTPLGPASAYQTYSISRRGDGGVVAACKDAGCEYWRDGWDSPVDERTPEGRLWAHAIRHESGRAFKELRRADGVTVFRFEPYQRCFRTHTVTDFFRVRDGDWRGNPTQRLRVHANGRDWAEDFALHEGALTDLRQKG